jgi:hypothetical protein
LYASKALAGTNLNQSRKMKKEIFKANGKTFDSYESLVNYLREIGARVTNTETFVYKGTRINTISITF